jgi:hypothetical protein
MHSLSLLSSLRQALESGDGRRACELLRLLRCEDYPPALLRPVLADCHPALDSCYLDLALLPPALLLAPRIPALLAEMPLDPLRLEQTHGCDLPTFVARDLPAVLRGARPLYAGLPAVELRHYHQLVQLNRRRRPWLRRLSALECLALEVEAGLEPELSALSCWAPSDHDSLLERPLVWLGLPSHQGDAALFALALGIQAVRELGCTEAEAVQLVDQAARLTLQGGGWFIVWSGKDSPPAAWAPLLHGLLRNRRHPLVQVGLDGDGATEILPARPSSSPSLLAIAAPWLAQRQPRQILAFFPALARRAAGLDQAAHRPPAVASRG